MQLVERGEFNLDQPVASQLAKPLNEYEPYRDTASEIVKDPAWPTVTPRMLLSHSSCMVNFAFPARAAGSMTTRADDLARFTSALFDNRIIKASTQFEMLSPVIDIHILHEFPANPNEAQGKEATDVGLAYGVGWGLL